MVLGLIGVLTSSPGMMLGGGCGKELAHWIIHGRPEKDMYGYDIRQGCAGTQWGARGWVSKPGV